jgi:ribonuclease BN (tRNA processing enzyme)
VFGIEHVFISHSHFDHCGGLPALLLTRHTARGDTEKPLTIHYPGDDDRFFRPLKQYAETLIPRNLDYEITWAPYDPENPTPIPVSIKGQQVRPFRSSHVPYLKTFSFVIEEERKRRKPEFESLSADEMRARAMAARDAGEKPEFDETYMAPILAYSGDALPIDQARIAGCGLVIHESTFLLKKDLDPKKKTHTALEELIPHLIAARVQGALVTHISARYTRKEIDAAFRRELDRHQPDFPIWAIYPQRPHAIESIYTPRE